jgi:uncharacterized membrane protein
MPVHPQAVHFPIALLFLAPVCELIGFFWQRDFFSKMSLFLLLAGTAGLGIAVLTGQNDATALTSLSGIQEILHEHERLALFSLYYYTVLSILKIALTYLKIDHFPWRILVLAGMLVGSFFIYRTALYGGKMVYQWGAGVKPVMESIQKTPTESTKTENPE